jgi:hypothetical protein
MQDLGYGGSSYRWSDATPGVSVGSVTIPTNGIQAAAQWDASGALTLLYTRDQLHGSIANGQNVQGVTSGFGGRMDAIYGGPVSSAFRWDTPESLTILDTQDGQWSESSGLDGQGNVWGWDGTNPVYWNAQGVKSIIPGKSGLSTYPVMVSHSGIAVGVSAVRDPNYNIVGTPVQATIAQGFSAMQILSNADSCEPVDVDNTGISIGNCWMNLGGSPIPVVWDGRTIRRLNLEIPDGVRHFTLRGMNDQEALVGAGFTIEERTGGPSIARTRGLLFSPVHEPPSLAIRLNQAVFRPGDTLRMDLELRNPGRPLTTDVYVGVILPDGQTILWLTNTAPLEGVVTSFTQASDPRSFVPINRGVTWPRGLNAVQHDYLTYTFTGGEGPGTYHLLVGWTKPNSLQDGRIDEGDVLALAWAPIQFNGGVSRDLSATMRAIQARYARR